MGGFSPPTRVLRVLCSQLPDCEVINGEIVVDKRPRDPSKELSHYEQTLLQVFRSHGPVLSYARARELCIDAGLNKTTTSIYLGNSPILRRVELGVYTVIGASVGPGEIEAVSKTARKTRQRRVMQDYGWYPDGERLWATYRISKGMLRSGVAGVPVGVKKYLTAEAYELSGADGTKIARLGVGGGSMWGLLPFFRRRGGEAGDYMRVSFGLSENKATIELSQEPFETE